MRQIEVADLQSQLVVDRRKIVRAVRRVLRMEGVADCILSIELVDNARIRELNRQFLGHDFVTDVLSFDLSDEGGALEGEIILSAERARQEAERRQADPQGEILLYAAHGCLHLLGYDDRAPPDAERMHCRENEILTELGYPGVYAGRP
jgi:probable rRNA maturation factor